MQIRGLEAGEVIKIEFKINAEELKNEGKESIQSLADFIKNKTNADVNLESRIINVSIENEEISKKYLRVLVKKFLHKSELKEYYRVLSAGDNSIKVREKKVYEE